MAKSVRLLFPNLFKGRVVHKVPDEGIYLGLRQKVFLQFHQHITPKSHWKKLRIILSFFLISYYNLSRESKPPCSKPS